MAKQFATRSTTANWVHASLCFGFGGFLLLAPVVCLALSWRTVKAGDIGALLLAFVVLMGGGAGFVALGIVCIRLTLFPQTLRLKKAKLQLCRREKILGEIP